MTKVDFPSLATRLFNTPLLVEPQKATVLTSVLAPRIFNEPVDIADPSASANSDLSEEAKSARASIIGDELFHGLKSHPGSGYSDIQGVAVIPIVGTLVRRGAWVGSNSGQTSYEGISAQIRAAVEDSAVKGIALEVDSFGGEAMGVFDLAKEIREARAIKPVFGFVSNYALSAGYALAAQASRLIAPPLAKVGSIGVVMLHADYSAQMKDRGVKVSLIHSGAHKVDGNPYEELPEEVRAAMQEEGDRIWSTFADQVGLGRGKKFSPKDALATEAQVFMAEDARRRGLIDEEADLRTAFAEFVSEVSDQRMKPSGARAETPTNESTDQSSGSGCKTEAEASQHKETGMGQATKTPETQTVSAPETQAETSQVQVEKAVEAATKRAAKINEKCLKAGLDIEFANSLINSDASLEEAFDKIIDKKADAAQDGGDIPNAARVTGDVVDRTKLGIEKALTLRANLEGGERNEFTGMTLREIARETLRARYLKPPTGGVMELVGAAFVPSMAGGGHGTSDFGNILMNIANKSMLKGFEEVDETFEKFTSVGSLADFKPTRRVGLDAFPSLLEVKDGAEFKFGTMGDHGETAVLATYGRRFSINRHAIINDDLDAFSKIPLNMGRAARRTVGDLVFAILTGNPKMSDGTALFHSNHKNLVTPAGGPSESGINAMITAMGKQKDRSENASALNIPLAFIIAPLNLRSQVLQSLNSEYAPDDTAKAGTAKQSQAYNTVKGAAEPIFDARLSGNSWFGAANPNQFDTIEVSYLDGVSTPFLDQQVGWSVDGTEFKVRLDAAATALAWEGLAKNAG